MSSHSAQPDFVAAFPLLQDQLACPACHGALRLQDDALLCAGCARRYPIVEGIPVLVPAAAQQAPPPSS